MPEENQTPPSAETKKPETKEEFIPKASFEAVSEKYKSAKSEAEQLRAKLAEIENAQLKEKESFKELAEKLERENQSLKLESFKTNLIQEALTTKEIHPTLSKMVVGSNEEEIKKSLDSAKLLFKEFSDGITTQKTAKDDSGAKTTEPLKMSKEQILELMKTDPKRADELLREQTNEAFKTWQL